MNMVILLVRVEFRIDILMFFFSNVIVKHFFYIYFDLY